MDCVVKKLSLSQPQPPLSTPSKYQSLSHREIKFSVPRTVLLSDFMMPIGGNTQADADADIVLPVRLFFYLAGVIRTSHMKHISIDSPSYFSLQTNTSLARRSEFRTPT